VAKIEGWPGKGKRPALGGKIIYQTDRGQLKAQSWPRKRGKPKSPITRAQNEWFRQANLLAKYAPSDDQWMSIAVAKGSPWYPRDLLMSAMKGRLFEVLIIDGQEYRAVATRDDVSSDLDFLAGTVEGTIIVRGPDLWQALIPATAGRVLTANGAASMPSWQPGAGAGSFQRVAQIPNTTFSSSAFACKGYPFRALEGFTISRVGTRLDATIGHTYKGHVFEIDASNVITALIAETADVPASGTVAGPYIGDLTSPAAMVAGTRYVIAWSRTDGGDAFALPMAGSASALNMIGLPQYAFGIVAAVNAWCRVAKAAPAVSDTFGVGSGVGNFCFADISI
jgi:hypothetical protein